LAFWLVFLVLAETNCKRFYTLALELFKVSPQVANRRNRALPPAANAWLQRNKFELNRLGPSRVRL
jgi:hypothetical protein